MAADNCGPEQRVLIGKAGHRREPDILPPRRTVAVPPIPRLLLRNRMPTIEFVRGSIAPTACWLSRSAVRRHSDGFRLIAAKWSIFQAEI